MARVSSKEKILESALELFSEKGYDGVGVDLIAQNAGFKGPSIYKHFSGKKAILEELMERGGSHYAQHFGNRAPVVETPPSLEVFIQSCYSKIEFTLHDPVIKKIRRLMTMEQFREPYLAEQATVYSIRNQRVMFGNMFRLMMEKGLMKKDDPDLLALEFLSPVTLMVQVIDRQPEKEEMCIEIVKKHFKHFVATYGEKGNKDNE